MSTACSPHLGRLPDLLIQGGMNDVLVCSRYEWSARGFILVFRNKKMTNASRTISRANFSSPDITRPRRRLARRIRTERNAVSRMSTSCIPQFYLSPSTQGRLEWFMADSLADFLSCRSMQHWHHARDALSSLVTF
ncbi:hypothetical protein OG21DRAFT_1142403 [Imleria badia]|nr:hypothetical protein OG21DRAFT_1142403 [Imleria badia]